MPQIAANLFVPICLSAVEDPYVGDLDTLLETLQDAGLNGLTDDDIDLLLSEAGLFLRTRLELVHIDGEIPYRSAASHTPPAARPYEPAADDEEYTRSELAFLDENIPDYRPIAPPVTPPTAAVAQHPRIDIAAMIPDPGPPLGGMSAKMSSSVETALLRPQGAVNMGT